MSLVAPSIPAGARSDSRGGSPEPARLAASAVAYEQRSAFAGTTGCRGLRHLRGLGVGQGMHYGLPSRNGKVRQRGHQPWEAATDRRPVIAPLVFQATDEEQHRTSGGRVRSRSRGKDIDEAKRIDG